MKTMMAVRIHKFGKPDVLVFEQAPKPEPKSNEVLIRVHAAGVNPLDCKIRAGTHPLACQMTFPGIIGWDTSGVVESVGSNVKNFKVGDHVYARTGDYTGHGAYAEYQAVKEDEIAIKPKSVSHVEAASLPLVALTTWQSIIDVAKLAEGQRILIHAAAGGCGSFAVQLAKAKGAYVIGTASSRNKQFLHSLGVDEFIDYNTTPFEKAVNNVDVVFDLIGGETQKRSWQVLKEGGILVSVVRPAPDEKFITQYKVRGELIVMQPNGKQLAQIAELVDSGKIKSIVSAVFPLKAAAQAHELMQTGHVRGKVVLEI